MRDICSTAHSGDGDRLIRDLDRVCRFERLRVYEYGLPELDKSAGRYPKPFTERPDLPNIQVALACEDFRGDTLTADLRQITLLQSVLGHQKLESLGTTGLRKAVVLGLVVRDQIAHDVHQPH